MKFGRVRFRVKKLVVTDLDAVQKIKDSARNNSQQNSSRFGNTLNIDMVNVGNERRLSDMSIA